MVLRIVGGHFKGHPLKAPKQTSTRPTQGMLREAVFNICQNRIEGANFLDIYAGSGAMGLEAISRGASHATFIEKNRAAAICIRENIANFKVESQAEIICQDAISALKKIKRKFTIAYIDPPYDTSLSPLMKELLEAEILEDDAIVFIEERDTKSAPSDFSPLVLKNSRRFGLAILHQYHKI